jgi:hypothetical protein
LLVIQTMRPTSLLDLEHKIVNIHKVDITRSSYSNELVLFHVNNSTKGHVQH